MCVNLTEKVPLVIEILAKQHRVILGIPCVKSQSNPSAIKSSVPQSSVLGPILLLHISSMLTTCFPVTVLVTISYDTQVIWPGDMASGLQRLATCVQDLQWCASRRLQLNAAKTELIWFGSHADLVIHQLTGPSKSGLLLYHLLMLFEIWACC